MFVTPLDKNDVVAAVLHDVVDGVAMAADVLDQHLLAGDLRPVDSDKEAVVARAAAVDVEAVAAVDVGGFEAGTSAEDLRRVGLKNWNDRTG